jgi:hypothetical protein
MLRFLTAFFLLSSALLGATGDILSVAIRPDGVTGEAVIEGKGTGGLYSFGLGANNVTSGIPRVGFTVTSHGFTDAGAATTKVRYIWGTLETRKPWPNDGDNEEVASGGNVTVRFHLSEVVYDEDDAGAGNSGVAITCFILASFYDQAGGNNAVSAGFPVTNNSTVGFQSVIPNWSWPGYQLADASTRFSLVAFHRHGEQGRPVRAVRFWMSDGTNEVDEWVTTPTIRIIGDAKPVIEYNTTGSLVTGLTQGAEITLNADIYPWVGDNVFLTSSGVAPPSPLVGPQKHVCNVSGTYGIAHAVVDAATGSDPAGFALADDAGKWVGDGEAHGTGSGVTAYATIARAARAIRNYNAARGVPVDDVGGGFVHVKDGNYNAYGVTVTGGFGSTPKTWLTVKPYTGHTAVAINGTLGSTEIGDRVKLQGIDITSNANSTFSSTEVTWIDQCYVTTTSTGLFATPGQRVYLTHSEVGQFEQGLKGFSVTDTCFNLIRGNVLSGLNDRLDVYTVLGNERTTTTAEGFSVTIGIAGTAAPHSIPILAFNDFRGCFANSGDIFELESEWDNYTGGAFVQNVIENYHNGITGLGSFGSEDGTAVADTGYDYDNFIIWHNTLVGGRCFVGYNADYDTVYHRRYWSQINNYWDRWANKGDNFAAEGTNRVGGWQVKFNVGSSGNYCSQNMNSLPDNFFAEFDGISSHKPVNYGSPDDALFVNRQSARAITAGSNTNVAGSGYGDYDLQSGSPLIGLPIVEVVSYDMDGVLRTSSNAASGAYAGPDPPSTLNATTTNATTVTVGP